MEACLLTDATGEAINEVVCEIGSSVGIFATRGGGDGSRVGAGAGRAVLGSVHNHSGLLLRAVSIAEKLTADE